MLAKRSYILSIVILILTGCTASQPQLQAPRAAITDTKIPPTVDMGADLANWQVNGKIGVQTSKNSGSALVNWSQHGARYTIALQGPAGANHMNLSGGKGIVVLNTGDGKRFTAKSPEELLARQWGFSLPVSSLYYWIRGMPVPNIPAKTQYDKQHQLIDLVQEGWKIKYLGYMKVGDKMMPQKVFAYSSALTVKVVIYNWRM